MQTEFNKLEEIINTYYDSNKPSPTPELTTAISAVLDLLDQGKIRVAEKINNHWIVHEWIKKAILLSFTTHPTKIIPDTWTTYYDKFASKFADYTQMDFQQQNIRVIPPATARRGCYLASNTVLLASYVNIGAYIDTGTMIDSYALVGSCAQIGKNVHLSGGAGIGGVLEPLQSRPTIIEDNCFIGAGSWIVEGVIVERNSVIAANVTIGQSTKIYNRETKEITYGRIPSGSVVVPGSLPSADNSYALAAAIIVKTVDEQTRLKTSLNDLLRN